MLKTDKDSLVRYLLIVSIILVAGAAFAIFFEKVFPELGIIFRFIGVLITPFAIAWLAAIITRPLNDWLIKKLHLPPTVAILLMMLLFFGIVTLLIVLVISVLADVLTGLAHYVSGLDVYAKDVSIFINELFTKLNIDYEQIAVYLEQVKDLVVSWATQGVNILLSVAKATPEAIILIFVTLVAVFYWCRDEEKVKGVLCNALPVKFRHRAVATYDNFSTVIGQYIRAQLILITISFVICTVGFTIIGAESPLAMGLFTGVMDIIPVLGPGTLIIPWAVWSFVVGDIGFGIGLLVIYIIVSVTRYILEPKIVGDRVGLHPLAALAAIFIGMKLFGLVGLILGPITLAVVLAMLKARRQRIILDPANHGPEENKDKERGGLAKGIKLKKDKPQDAPPPPTKK